MAIDHKCRTNQLQVRLDLKTQKLRYSVEVTGDVTFTIRSELGQTLLDMESTPLERLWPLDATELPSGPRVSHVIGIAFGNAGGMVHWVVKRTGGSKEVVVKDCTYSSGIKGDEFFDALAISSKRVE